MTRVPGLVFPPAATGYDPPDLGQDDALNEAVNIQIAGRSNLFLADANAGQTPGELQFLGEQMDDTPIVHRDYFNDVPGDSHGGPQGPPIERQLLGKVLQISFNLSTWSHGARKWLERHNNAISIDGTLLDYEIGEPLIERHAFRLLIVPTRSNPSIATPTDKSTDYFCFNLPCCVLSSPVEASQGTKFTGLRFTLEAHRAPPSWETPQNGVLWNRDITGLAAAQQSLQAHKNAEYAKVRSQRARTDHDAAT